MKEQKYWFKRRRYGFGWTPTSWQGWVTVAMPAVAVLIVAIIAPARSRTQWVTIIFMVAVLCLVVIAYKKSPKARWRWGKTPGDNPDEDL